MPDSQTLSGLLLQQISDTLDSIDAAVPGIGGGVQYTEGDTDTTLTGTMMMWEDTSDTVRSVSASKPLPVNIVSGSSSGTQYDTNTAYQDADTGTLVLTVRDDALSTLTEIDGDYSALRVTSTGALWTTFTNTTIAVTNAGTFLVQENGGVLTSLQLIDDVVYIDDADWTDSTSKHMLVGGLYQSTPQTITDGDVAPFNMTSTGAMHVHIASGASSGTQYDTNTAYQDADTGTLVLTVRDDALSTLTEIDGDYSALRVGSTGALWVTFTNTSLTVDLGANNDVTVTGTVDLGAVDNAVLDAIAASLDTLDSVDYMLGTDFSAVFGSSSLLITTQADDIANTQDTLAATAFLQVFDGTTWDRARGDATNGLLVNLGANNDVTVTGSLTTVTTVSTVTTLTTLTGTTSLTPGTAAGNLGKAEDAGHTSGDVGVFALGVRNDTTTQTSLTSATLDYSAFAVDIKGNTMNVGNVAHDEVDAGKPVKVGMRAVALKATPTDVAAADRTDWLSMRNGIPFVMPGHPNTVSQSLQVTDADGAQTDAAVVSASAGTSIVVTKVSVMADNANTGDVSVRIGFGTASTPAVDAAQVLFFHPGIAPGSGAVEGSGSGIIGIGASDEDLRVTCEDPAGGSVNIIVTYFTASI